jgi:hypothetical protein
LKHVRRRATTAPAARPPRARARLRPPSQGVRRHGYPRSREGPDEIAIVGYRTAGQAASLFLARDGGDAAHGMSPQLRQGVNTALLDAQAHAASRSARRSAAGWHPCSSRTAAYSRRCATPASGR